MCGAKSMMICSQAQSPSIAAGDIKKVMSIEQERKKQQQQSPSFSPSTSPSIMSNSTSPTRRTSACSTTSTDSSESTSTTIRMRGRTIRFSKNCKMYLIPHMSTYSEEERSACWLNESDYKKIRKESYLHRYRQRRHQQQTACASCSYDCTSTMCRHQLHESSCKTVEPTKLITTAACQCEDSDSDDICSDSNFDCRGLEVLVDSKALKRRVKNRVRAANLVFDEQEDQWEEQIVDEELIRQAYRQITTKCADDAHRAALKDAIEAMQYLNQSITKWWAN